MGYNDILGDHPSMVNLHRLSCPKSKQSQTMAPNTDLHALPLHFCSPRTFDTNSVHRGLVGTGEEPHWSTAGGSPGPGQFGDGWTRGQIGLGVSIATSTRQQQTTSANINHQKNSKKKTSTIINRQQQTTTSTIINNTSKQQHQQSSTDNKRHNGPEP